MDHPTHDGDAAERNLPRRDFLGRMGLAGIGAAGLASALLSAGCGSGSGTIPIDPGAFRPDAAGLPTGFTDADLLNFALNLEYLEAEYYLRAVNGQGLSFAEAGGDAAGAVTGGRAVNFSSSAVRQYAQELAADERAHVNLLRGALGSAAVARPQINFTDAFNAAAQAAGIGQAFDPFADELSFLIGSFVFEDVGVTAYQGAAGLVQNLDILEAAAGLLAAESYHAGEIRTLISQVGGAALDAADKVSALRAAAGGGKDQPIGSTASPNIVPTDANAIVFGRTPAEVLRIVFLTPTGAVERGGFFPAGIAGRVNRVS